MHSTADTSAFEAPPLGLVRQPADSQAAIDKLTATIIRRRREQGISTGPTFNAYAGGQFIELSGEAPADTDGLLNLRTGWTSPCDCSVCGYAPPVRFRELQAAGRWEHAVAVCVDCNTTDVIFVESRLALLDLLARLAPLALLYHRGELERGIAAKKGGKR